MARDAIIKPIQRFIDMLDRFHLEVPEHYYKWLPDPLDWQPTGQKKKLLKPRKS